jgi:hypothetical protein
MAIIGNGYGAGNRRVQANGVFMRTVVANGATVFNLNAFWSYVGLQSGSVDVTFAGTLNTNTQFTSTGFTLCNQATSLAAANGANQMASSFPTQNYGGGAFGQITIWEVRNRFGQLARCTIDFGFPPLRYQVQGQY